LAWPLLANLLLLLQMWLQHARRWHAWGWRAWRWHPLLLKQWWCLLLPLQVLGV
jgi:hypothetical protein